MDITSQSIRAVQFREKLRGYHPDDVDAFVAEVAKGVEQLEDRVKIAESRIAEVEARQSGTAEAEDSLRRTLVLAQRTADAAIQEARDEAARVAAESAEHRAAAEAELASWRQQLTAEADHERSTLRQELVAERAALQADIAALTTHFERERERLRIYFSDQLQRLAEGEPGVAPSPEMQAPEAPTDEAAPPAATDSRVAAEFAPSDASTSEAGQDANGIAGDGAAGDGVPVGDEEDPFLAELRRAVNDDRPLGPREDEPEAEAEAASSIPGSDDDGFGVFAKGDDEDGRFGSRRRRRR